MGVLMPETGDGTQGLPQKSTPVRTPFSHKGRRGSVGVLMPETIASYVSACDARGKGECGRPIRAYPKNCDLFACGVIAVRAAGLFG